MGDDYATLARQLAEAKALLATPLPADYETYPVLSSDHRAAKARCASKRGTSEDAKAMRLCAEACSAYSLKLGEIGGNYARALHRIAELEQAESKLAEATRRLGEVGGWISVEDRQPETTGMYLVTVATDDGPETLILQFHKGKDHWDYEGEPTFSHGFYIEVTHWMPRPEPMTKEPPK